MLPTPDTPALPGSVYPPSEDSYLLLDTLSDPQQAAFLTKAFSDPPSPLVVDLGTGSGVILALILAHAKTMLGRSDAVGLGIDLNPDACVYSRQTVLSACKQETSLAAYLTTINTSLFAGIRQNQVDLFVFNPPYVPTPDVPRSKLVETERPRSSDKAYERESHLISLTYSGGKDGMEVTNEVLAELPNVLSGRGVAYILLCKANKVEEVIERVRKWPADRQKTWKAEVVRSSGKQAGWERLVVVRLWRDTDE